MKSALHEIDKESRRLGVFIVCEREGKTFVAVTAMDHPTDHARIIIGVSGAKDSQEIAIIEAWERGLPFYEKVKNADPEILAGITA